MPMTFNFSPPNQPNVHNYSIQFRFSLEIEISNFCMVKLSGTRGMHQAVEEEKMLGIKYGGRSNNKVEGVK